MESAREFVELVARMKTEEEFGEDAPPSEDWICSLNELIATARGILNEKPESKEDAEYRSKAIAAAESRYVHGSDCAVEIDDNAQLSVGDDGAFVQAWVWVSNAEMGLEEQAPEKE